MPGREELARLIGNVRSADDVAERQAGIDQIYELISGDERARVRLDELLPEEEAVFRGYEPLAGDQLAGDDSFDRMVCPNGDYAWPILDVADPAAPQVCPNDGALLSFHAAGS